MCRWSPKSVFLRPLECATKDHAADESELGMFLCIVGAMVPMYWPASKNKQLLRLRALTIFGFVLPK